MGEEARGYVRMGEWGAGWAVNGISSAAMAEARSVRGEARSVVVVIALVEMPRQMDQMAGQRTRVRLG